jgi:hypothetical protein
LTASFSNFVVALTIRPDHAACAVLETGVAAWFTGKRAGIGISGPTTRPWSSKAQNRL